MDSGNPRRSGWESNRFRNLWVNDQRAIRARSPNADAPDPYYHLREVYLSPDERDYVVTLGNNEVKPWKKIIEVELITLGDWEITDYPD